MIPAKTGARILIVNDDGVASEGLYALADAMAALGAVVVVAPDEERSGTGHAISARHAVAVRRLPDRPYPTYACGGSPADCVVLGVHELAGGPVDLVASGINRGANAGDDVNYSGTVAAGFEGILMGARALAVSLAASWPQLDRVHHWATAGAIAADVARRLLAAPPAETLLNVNVPNLPLEGLAGVRPTRLGRKRYRDRVERRGDEAFGYVWGTVEQDDDTLETDLGALARGWASVTPLRLDRTDAAALARLAAGEREPSDVQG